MNLNAGRRKALHGKITITHACNLNLGESEQLVEQQVYENS